MNGPPLRMTGTDWAMLLLCSVFWGSAYIFNKLTIAEVPPLTFTAARLMIAAGFLWLIARASGVAIPPPGRAWAPFFVFTLLSNVVPFQMVLEGQRSVTAGLASVLGATTPLFVILLAHVFTSDEKISLAKLTGVLIGMVGVATVFGPEVFDGWTTAAGAKALLVGAAVLYAAGAIWSKRLTGHPPLAMATMQMTAGLILTAPLSLLLEQPWTIAPPSWLAITGIFGTAIFGSALAAVTYFHVFRRAGATNAMLVTLLVPVTPILIGAALFGEHLLAREAIGALVIAFALVVIDGRLFAALRRRLKGPA